MFTRKDLFRGEKPVQSGGETRIDGHLHQDLGNLLPGQADIQPRLDMHFQLRRGGAHRRQRGNRGDLAVAQVQPVARIDIAKGKFQQIGGEIWAISASASITACPASPSIRANWRWPRSYLVSLCMICPFVIVAGNLAVQNGKGGLQFRDLRDDQIAALAQNRGALRPGLRPLLAQPCIMQHVLYRHARRFHMANEGDPDQRIRPVIAMPGRVAKGGRHQADPFVIADRMRAAPTAPGQFGNLHGNLPCQTPARLAVRARSKSSDPLRIIGLTFGKYEILVFQGVPDIRVIR